MAAAALLYHTSYGLLDPLAVPAMLVATFASAALAASAATRRQAAALRRRFEQHLAPAVVQRLVDEPALLKLAGERREVTCLFTDIEGFTAMTERAEPEALVALLDHYLGRVGEIVVAHGGMVDKFVGDAVHAIFNAPLDLADHPHRALDCARAILAATEEMRKTPEARHLGLGRTRIGLETGPAIVGDVGGGGKLDYTAHGNVINAAARLEAANKDFGSSIAIGPELATRIGEGELRPLGTVILRGRSLPQAIFTVPSEDPAARITD
jgi:adenylate cyclase